MLPRIRAPATCMLLAAALLVGCVGPPDHAPNPHGQGLAVVATSHPLAAGAGAAVLAAGGTAADAAAAIQFVLNLVEPAMSGIGGGAFVLYWDASTSNLTFIDGRETAPAASTPDQFLDATGAPRDRSAASRTGLAVGVPGTLAAMDALVERHGRLTLADALEPAAALAEIGFPVNADLAGWLREPATQDKLKSWPATARLYFPGTVCPVEGQPGVGTQPVCVYGQPLSEGQTFRNPDLAATFRLIQRDGPRALYQGPIGQDIVAAQAARDGRMTMADLAAYQIVDREPVRRAYGEFEVATAPPPGGGVTVLQILGILERFTVGQYGPNSADALHYTIEAMHLAYADRARYVGDPAFVDVPVTGLLNETYLAARAALIQPDRTRSDVQPGDPWPYTGRGGWAPGGPASGGEGNHTTHFVVVDHDGSVASVTTTIESLFGTGMVVPGRGFFLNNELTDFDFEPGGANQVEGGKRPRSSMSPSIVFADGRPVGALGSPGGTTIIATAAQALLNLIEHDTGLNVAVHAARVFSATHPNVAWEDGIEDGVRSDLAKRGHAFAASPAVLGDVQAAWRVNAQWEPEADHRRQGGEAVVPPP